MIVGCDFSSSPSRRKAIVLARGRLAGARVVLEGFERFDTLAGWGQWLAAPGAWVGGFDVPFGLPRELIEHLGWPLDWLACIRHYQTLSRPEIRDTFAAFCDDRPAGGKFAHRACDRPAASSPSMKWVNPPVAFMLHAGLPLLIDAGVHIPALHTGDASRVALEAYPGFLAREVLDGHGTPNARAARRSYKSDDTARQTPERLIARKDLVTALENGISPFGPLASGLRLKLSHAQHDLLVADASGDTLDAVLCLMQAAWGWRQHQAGAPNYGLPANVDPLEGWIVTVPASQPPATH